MNKKADRRIIRSKRLLKHSLISLLGEKSFNDITITDIVNRSELNRSTFYSHFSNKEELLNFIIDDLLAGMILSMKNDDAPNLLITTQTEFTRQSTLKLFSYISEHASFFKTLMNYHRVPHFSFCLSDSLYNFYLSKIKEERHSSNQINMNHGFLANYIASIIVGFIYHWLIHTDNKYNPEYINKEFNKIFLLGNDLQTISHTHK